MCVCVCVSALMYSLTLLFRVGPGRPPLSGVARSRWADLANDGTHLSITSHLGAIDNSGVYLYTSLTHTYTTYMYTYIHTYIHTYISSHKLAVGLLTLVFDPPLYTTIYHSVCVANIIFIIHIAHVHQR